MHAAEVVWWCGCRQTVGDSESTRLGHSTGGLSAKDRASPATYLWADGVTCLIIPNVAQQTFRDSFNSLAFMTFGTHNEWHRLGPGALAVGGVVRPGGSAILSHRATIQPDFIA